MEELETTSEKAAANTPPIRHLMNFMLALIDLEVSVLFGVAGWFSYLATERSSDRRRGWRRPRG